MKTLSQLKIDHANLIKKNTKKSKQIEGFESLKAMFTYDVDIRDMSEVNASKVYLGINKVLSSKIDHMDSLIEAIKLNDEELIKELDYYDEYKTNI